MGDICRHLRLGHEDRGLRIGGESILSDVPHHSHNFGRRLVGPRHDNPAAYRVLIWEVLPGECSVDEADARTANAITFVERAPFDDGNAHGGEVSSAVERSLSDGLFSRSRFRLPLEIESGPAGWTERQELNDARRVDLGQSLNAVEDG